MSKELKRRKDKAKANRELYRDLLESAYDYIIPERNNFSTKTEGDEEDAHVYDETAPLAIPRFASRMHRSLFPEGEDWVQFKAGSNVSEDEKQSIDDALEQYTNTFFSEFNQTNFHTEINPALIDCGISTGVIQVEEESPTSDILASYSCIPLNEIAFERPIKGELVNCWRSFKMVAERIEKTWPKADIPQELAKQIKQDPFCEIEIDLGQIKEGKIFKIYVLWEEHTLLEEEFNSQRIIPFRLNAFPDETFGRGPGILSLQAIKDMNEIQKLIIENAAINVAGMYTARSDGVFNPWTFTVSAGGVIPVSSNDSANPTLARLPNAGDLNMGMIVLEEKRTSINKAFFVDPLGDISDPVRSATEQTMRMQEFLKDQGAGIARLRTELVEKIVMSFVDIAQSRGRLPKDIKVDGKEIKIEHNTTLVKAERQDEYQNLMTWMNSLAAVLPPEAIMATVNIEELPAGMAEMLSVSSKFTRSKAEIEEIKQQASQAIEQELPGPE